MAPVKPSSLQSQIERRLRDALLSHESLSQATTALAGQRRLLSQAFRLTSATAPKVMEALAACQEVLGNTEPVEVFVQPEAMCRALMLRGPARTPTLLLTTRLLETLTPAELRFVLGRALGHWVLDHLELPPLASAVTTDPFWRTAPPAVLMGASVWRQAAKVSADRAGLLCAPDTEVAASALFKLSSGLATAPVKTELQARTREVESLFSGEEVREKPRGSQELLGCFGTHPFSPLRLRALVAFTATKTFRGSAGLYASEDGRTNEEADILLARDLQALESTAHEQARPEGEAREASVAERARRLRHHCWAAAAQGRDSDESLSGLLRQAESWALPLWLVDESLRDAAHPLD